MRVILKNKTSNMIIAHDVARADRFFKRLKGLMFTRELSPQSGLYIYPCSSIHTCFMNYKIDVLYLSILNIVLAVDEGLEPWKIGKHVKNAVAVVELPDGRIRETQTQVGQAVEFL